MKYRVNDPGLLKNFEVRYTKTGAGLFVNIAYSTSTKTSRVGMDVLYGAEYQVDPAKRSNGKHSATVYISHGNGKMASITIYPTNKAMEKLFDGPIHTMSISYIGVNFIMMPKLDPKEWDKAIKAIRLPARKVIRNRKGKNNELPKSIRRNNSNRGARRQRGRSV